MVFNHGMFRAVYLSTLITVGFQSSLGAVVFRPVPLTECSTTKKSVKEKILDSKIDELCAVMETGHYPKSVRKILEIKNFIERHWKVSIDTRSIIDKCFQVIHEANLARLQKRREMKKQREELEKRFGYSTGEYTDPYEHLHEIENILEGVDVDGLNEQMHRVLEQEEEFFEHEQQYREECQKKNSKFVMSEYNAVFLRDYGTTQEEMDSEIKKEMNVPSEIEMVIIFGCAASFLSFVCPLLPEVIFLSNLMYTFAGSAVVMLATYMNSPKKDEK